MDRPFARTCKRHWALIVALLAVVATGCSTGGSSGPQVVDADDIPSSAPPVQGLAVSPGQVWGDGRAVAAHRLPSGEFAVVTTTGVYLMDATAPEPVRLDEFDTAVQIGTTALAPDGSTLAVAALSPPEVRLYDLTDRTSIGSFGLPAEAQTRSLEFDAASGRLLIDSTAGPYVVSGASTPPQRLLDSPTSGTPAIVNGGAVVTPVIDSADIVVSDADGNEQRSLTLAESGTVVDAHASRSGSVAVSAAVGADEFESTTQIGLLDPATIDQRGTIDTGRTLESWQWVVAGDSVVAADGPNLIAWTSDGQATPATSSQTAPITELHATAGGVLSVHANGAVVLWSAGTWSPQVIDEGGTALASMAIDGDGLLASAVDYFGSVRAWNIADGASLAEDNRFAIGETTGVAVSIDGTQVGVSSSSGQVAVLDSTLADKWVFQASDTPEVVGTVSFDPASGGIATGLAQRAGATAFDDTVTLWDEQQRGARFSVGGEREDVDGCSFFLSRIRYSNDATMMAVTSHDFSVLVLNVATGEVLHLLPGNTTVLDLAFSPDDDLLVATYDDGSVNIWQTTDFSLAGTYRGAQGGYFAIAVMPDSATMAVTDVTGSIGLVDVMTGEPLRSFSDATYRISTIALSPDGALLAAPTAGAGIGIWSTFSGERVATLTGHAGAVTGLAFSPQGDWLASSSSDGTARTWTLDRVG